MSLSQINGRANVGDIIGFTCSSFDLLHAGHIAMLAEAKAHCDYLVVGLMSDPTTDRPNKNKPVQSLFERYIQLQAVKYVDLIIPYESEADLLDMLYVVNPDIRFVGEEYRGLPHTGHDMKDIEIFYNRRQHSFSSSDLRERVATAEANNGNRI